MFQIIKKITCDLDNYSYLMKILHALKKFKSGFFYLKSRNKWFSSPISKIINSSLTYGDLDHFRICNPTIFYDRHSKIVDYNVNQLRENTKISVGFLVFTSSMWNCHDIYCLFEKDPHYDPVIIVRTEYNGKLKIKDELYQSTLNYFEKNNYNIIGLADLNNRQKLYNDLELPNIIFHQQPYPNNSILSIQNLPITVLNIYIPYSMSVDARQQNRYNALGYQMSWKVFCSSRYDLELYRKYADNKGVNGIFLGYPKMDPFYQNEIPVQPLDIWKIPKGCDVDEITKIIYAPHHSIGEKTIQFSTFAENYITIFEYAKTHPETTSWIIKPHPALKYQSIIDGLFKDETEFDEYMDKWNALPNARAIVDGSYVDMFKTSDGMIVDSVSFLSEYQYLGKPLLFLTRPEQKFTPYGERLIEILYTAPGSDFQAIVQFIECVLIKKEDPMKIKRADFFKEYLDYKNETGPVSASEAIYRHIKSSLE